MMHNKSMEKLIKRAAIAGMMGVLSSPVVASAASQRDFINRLAPDVQRATNQYNLYASLQMSQAILESAWGKSTLSSTANNYFGIKGTYNGASVDMNTAEMDANGNLYYITAQFKKYPSAYESMVDNASLLRNGLSLQPDRYAGTWRENASSGIQAANALTGTYATDQGYGSKLQSLIRTYDLESLDARLQWRDGKLLGFDQHGNRLYNVWWNFNGFYYYFDGNGNALMDLQK
ncbi:glycoside hydrolase family 73 protein, partial [Weissella confusa]|uniref:glycoside hydrolase family 73 protein n=1 Tax=Weissella confusa TaxID=1583 RepID=UPI0022FDD232